MEAYAMRFLIATAVLALFATLSVASTLTCTLTGKKIDSCCCQQKGGKLYCPLVDKTLDDCCCK